MKAKDFEDSIYHVVHDLESVSDGFQTTYPYGEVIKAMQIAYNKAIDDALALLDTNPEFDIHAIKSLKIND